MRIDKKLVLVDDEMSHDDWYVDGVLVEHMDDNEFRKVVDRILAEGIDERSKNDIMEEIVYSTGLCHVGTEAWDSSTYVIDDDREDDRDN